MAPSSILSIIHTITIGAMLNCSGGINGHGRKNVMCKQNLTQIQAHTQTRTRTRTHTTLSPANYEQQDAKFFERNLLVVSVYSL